jgi:hypothetical protein
VIAIAPDLAFTVPRALDGWAELHPRELYGLLFETVWATLSAFGADPKRLNGQMGMTAVLHIWGQTLVRHVHLHCLVPGGALSAEGTRHPARSTALFPVRALSRHVRGGSVSRLRHAWEAGELPPIRDAVQVDPVLDALMGPSGWSTPSPVSPTPRRWSITLAATPFASRSPTAGCSISMANRWISATGTTARAAGARS